MRFGYRRAVVLSTLLLAAHGCGGDSDDSDDTAAAGSPVGTVGSGSDGGAAPDAAMVPPGGGAPVAGDMLPIIFVHGFAGSASQFESQAIRFVANGYPQERIRAFDHSGDGFDVFSFVAGVDQYVNDAIRDFGVQKVFLVGHSRGTLVSSLYLADPASAAKVAKYVSLDGAGCGGATNAGVPCIAPSQTTLPGQKHVEVATSAESFEQMFEHFLGRKPAVSKIVKQTGPVKVSGRVVNFPANTGRAGTTLEFYEINSATGARTAAQPIGSFNIGEDGNWGPQMVDPDKHYELALKAPDAGTQHFYPQRFLRDSHLIRLLSGGMDSPARINTNSSDKHAAITALRMREWTGEDVLEIKVTSQSAGEIAAVDAIAGIAGMPTDGMGGVGQAIGLYIHDDVATPQQSSLAPLPYFSTQPFQAGVDVYMPAAEPTDGTITLTNYPRGDRTKPQVLNIPNWRSSQHFLMAMFSDYPQE